MSRTWSCTTDGNQTKVVAKIKLQPGRTVQIHTVMNSCAEDYTRGASRELITSVTCGKDGCVDNGVLQLLMTRSDEVLIPKHDVANGELLVTVGATSGKWSHEGKTDIKL
jgi:hypothetical protein